MTRNAFKRENKRKRRKGRKEERVQYRSTSCIENALIPCSRSTFFSSRSMSLSPMYTNFVMLIRCSSPSHPNTSSLSSTVRPVKKLNGIPCTFPLGEPSGEFMSACASTQMIAISRLPPKRSRIAFAVPEIVPMAMEWSPPRVSTRRPWRACS